MGFKKGNKLFNKRNRAGLKPGQINSGSFKKGNVSPRKGVKLEKKIKEKISKSLKGRNVSQKTQFKRGHKLTKEQNEKANKNRIKFYDKNGRKTKTNTLIRNSKEYKIWRKAVFERDKFTCRFCGKVGVRLNADHIKPFALFPELRFAIDNGRTLCEECHKKTETFGGNSKR